MTKEEFCVSETRDGYHIDQKTKKIWYTQICLYQEFDRFCRTNDLRYYADYGTLLGAVRHKGFIPWDDDMDFTMPRPDYQRMIELAPGYFNDPAYFQNYHTEPGATRIYNFSRIRDERTTCFAKDSDETRDDHPGIFIDIFPLDAVPPVKTVDRAGGVFEIALDIWKAASDPRSILDDMIKGKVPVAGTDTMLDVLGLPFADRLSLYENILAGIYDENEYINFFPYQYDRMPNKKEWYSDVVELPFEFLSVPAPKDYDLVLKTLYGDYHKPVMNGSYHEIGFVDPDRPYTDYL